MNQLQWHWKSTKKRYLSQKVARNQVEAIGQQSRDQQCVNWITSIMHIELNFDFTFKWQKIGTIIKGQNGILHTNVLSQAQLSCHQ